MQNVLNVFFFLLVGGIIFLWLRESRKRRKSAVAPKISPRQAHRMLLKGVRFYRELSREEQAEFRERAKSFLETVAITPVGKAKVKVMDRLYVAAAAIIPIFRFKDWNYRQLNEVLLVPGNFTKDFRGTPEEANVLGMVGDGAMHRMMVLSIGALRTGFEQAGRGNTAIHEFVHLLDKADGAVDGLPEELMSGDNLSRPWLEYMHREISAIRAGKSDINPYGATSEAEFLAVASEYFFQRPQDFEEKHPELFQVLNAAYGIQPTETVAEGVTAPGAETGQPEAQLA